MKKFYEQPVVEITVFDVENIMTASAPGTPDDVIVEINEGNIDAVAAMINAQNVAGQAAYATSERYNNAYNW